jgi:hypothetical protein
MFNCYCIAFLVKGSYLGLYSQLFIFFTPYNGPNRLECYFTLDRKGLSGTNLSGLFLSYEENEVLLIRPQY